MTALYIQDDDSPYAGFGTSDFKTEPRTGSRHSEEQLSATKNPDGDGSEKMQRDSGL